MIHLIIKKNLKRTLIAAALVFCSHTNLRAQETSLFRQAPPQAWAQGAPAPGQTMQAPSQSSDILPPPMNAPASGVGFADVGLANASWTYTPSPPLRTFRIQDIVTIRVDELTRMRADGAIDSRRNGLYNAVLKEWVSLRGGNLRKDLQSSGDPEISGQTNQLYRSNASVQSRESLAFNVAARVVDIQPNGNLVLEARKTIWMNDNIWETSLSGVCRAQDIAPDNIILSRDLLDLEIHKNETGEVRDGYKRGWLTRWINEFNPF